MIQPEAPGPYQIHGVIKWKWSPNHSKTSSRCFIKSGCNRSSEPAAAARLVDHRMRPNTERPDHGSSSCVDGRQAHHRHHGPVGVLVPPGCASLSLVSVLVPP
ncbi:hypothetical protein PanWU01x14_047980 [Parasponia andersonii]|uniref:Uncharacterized protein n=1 Tax=Parasponia andersonii TaxID=3476 RepID=A0A2P5DN64_PARAD|nr:hypothetical protein PanWU01x14_047980 [Parasponia andersonii]